MTAQAGDVLRRAVASPRLGAHWTAIDIGNAVHEASDQLSLGGIVLPLTSLEGRRVLPIVELGHAAIARRRTLGCGPILDRLRLRRFAAGLEPLPPAAIRMVAFVSPMPIRQAMDALNGLSAWARTVIVVPHDRPPTTTNLIARDYLGHSVVSADGEGATVLLDNGDPIDRRDKPRSAWRMLRQEQLFGLAISSGFINWP